MYEALFQTPDRPFRATPDVRFYFPFDSMEQTRQTILRVVRRAEGPAAVMAGVGLGKSLLAQLLGEDLKDRFDVVRLHAARLCSRRAMLQNILFELGLPYRDLSEGELRLSLMERMEPAPEHAPDGLALIVDEAQTLPTKLLEELRLVANFARQGQARARMVLLGSMHLEETFALPEMSSFNQRLAARCFLQTMTRAETADFVRHQFLCVGVDAKHVITRDALENVYVASEGIPRLANQVMDHALILAIANDQYPISAALVQEAWSDLQQLPLSWGQPESTSAPPVEFGSIDDLDQDFELEPEGIEELSNVCQSELDWPAASDLEDFGPSTSRPVASPAEPMEQMSFASPTDSPRASMSPSASGRVVFDASALFNERPGFNDLAGNHALPSKMARPSESISGRSSQPDDMHSLESDHDLFIFQEDDQPTAGELPVVRNVFESWDRGGDALTYDQEPAPRSSTMAMTEITFRLPADRAPTAVPMPLARAEEPVSGDPFGQDFDEEFAVDASDVRRWQERQRASRQALRAKEAAKAQAAAAAGHRAAAHAATAHAAAGHGAAGHGAAGHGAAQPTQAVVGANLDGQPHNSYAHSGAETIVQPEFSGAMASDFVSATSTGAVDQQVQQEIEDLISQLNFSAFSVELDSVEQISPEFTRAAVGASNFSQTGDRDRQSEYASRPIRREEQPHAIEMTTFDDDRDLLIIEEEVPASVRHANVSSAPPTINSVSYPELFQQLRG